MGDSKFKLPKPTVPDFMDKAKKSVERATNNLNIPDFAKKASEKFAGIKKQVENPDTDQLMSIIEKFNAARNISSIAQALGIDLQEEQVQKVIDKKHELESAIGSKTIGAVTSFMEKEGYSIESPDKLLTNTANRLQKGDDPLDIAKDAAEPFANLAKDTLNGNHSISAENAIGSIINSKKGSIMNSSIGLINSVEEAYYSTKYDKALLQQLEQNPNTMNTWMADGENENKVTNTLLVALADSKVSSKTKDKIQDYLLEKYPDLDSEKLNEIRNTKDQTRPFRNIKQLIAKDEAEYNSFLASNDSIFSDIKEEISPYSEKGQELFPKLKENINKMKEQIPNIDIPEVSPPTISDVKTSFSNFINNSDIAKSGSDAIRKYYEAQNQKRIDKELAEKTWQEDLEKMRAGVYTGNFGKLEESMNDPKIKIGKEDLVEYEKKKWEVIMDPKISDSMKSKLFKGYSPEWKTHANDFVNTTGLKIDGNIPTNIANLINKYLHGGI